MIPNNVSFHLAPDISRDIVVNLQSISLTDPTRIAAPLLPTATLIFIDSTIPFIYLPVAACEAFEAELGLTWNYTEERFFVNDTLHQSLIINNPTFTFSIGNDEKGESAVDIELPYASFDFIKYLNTMRYFPLQRGTNESQYALGRVFLQEAYVLFDLYL